MAYYKIRMVSDVNTYHVYVSANDKTEARQAIRYELLEDEKEDIIDAITEITKEEYEKGYQLFGQGERI